MGDAEIPGSADHNSYRFRHLPYSEFYADIVRGPFRKDNWARGEPPFQRVVLALVKFLLMHYQSQICKGSLPYR